MALFGRLQCSSEASLPGGARAGGQAGGRAATWLGHVNSPPAARWLARSPPEEGVDVYVSCIIDRLLAVDDIKYR